MDSFLTPISTTYRRPQPVNEALLKDAKSSEPAKVSTPRLSSSSSADDVLEILRGQPDYNSLVSVLKFLTRDGATTYLQLHIPSPKNAIIAQSLVTEIAPNYWPLLEEASVEHGGDKAIFIQCLRSVVGVNAILSHIMSLIQESKRGAQESTNRFDISLHLKIFMDLLSAVLEGSDSVKALWITAVSVLPTEALKKGQSLFLTSLLANGKLVSLAAEGSNILLGQQRNSNVHWMTRGHDISKWIGLNIVSWVQAGISDDGVEFCRQLFQKSLSLGYPDTLTRSVVDGLLLVRGRNPAAFAQICLHQASTTRKVLNLLLDYLSERFLDPIYFSDSNSNATVSAVSTIIASTIQGDESRINQLVHWCTTPSGAGLGHGIGIRRAVLSVVSRNREDIITVLEKSLAQFGDELYIKHAPVLQQLVHTEILLLSAGYVFRLSSIKLTMLLRSGTYLSAISNRIATTQLRPRFLGLVVGECLSGLVDKKDTKLSFHMEEMDTEEAGRLKSLVHVLDEAGTTNILMPVDSNVTAKPKPQPKPVKHVTEKKKRAPRSTSPLSKPRAIIEEVGSSDDDDDLVPYSKHSDPEDSDEDPELVQRNKLKPPVYIRDLITYLRDSESYDKQKLGLQTAPLLIRRKANHGTEVSAHAKELAGLFVSVQDKFELEDFGNLKLQGMIALVVAQPKAMAPWFARTFFEGDYSLSQRTSLLVTLGLSARELAGFSTPEYNQDSAFPSKKLPEKIEQLYINSPTQPPSSRLKALPSTALESITKSITSTFLTPIAAEAADTATGPDVLKLETFTTRYKSRSINKPRVRSIPNTTANLLATSFFSPLTAHFQVAIRSSRAVVLNPALLGLYLQTLGIIIHAAGPSTLSLPQLTSELWDLLLGVRQHVFGDLGALRGWLVAMSSLLFANEGDLRRLCEVQGREVVETREWVSVVFEGKRGEDGGEENEVKMLAAGVLIRLGEAIEKYQAVLMGDMVGFN